MKPRVFSKIYLIAALFILVRIPDASLAVTFPVTYEGTVHGTADLSDGMYAGDEQMKITLYANGKLEETTDAIVSTPGPNKTACEIVSTTSQGYPWRLHEGTHDKAGTFSFKMDFVPVTGTFNDETITGTGSASDGYLGITYSFTLQAKGTGQPPKIKLEPADHPAFQANVLMGGGFHHPHPQGGRGARCPGQLETKLVDAAFCDEWHG